MTLIISIIEGFSQRESITLTFHAKDSLTQNSLSLDSVNVLNLTAGCDTTLFDSVSVLTLEATWPVGAEEPASPLSESFIVMQNMPNPFQGSTFVRICLKNKGDLKLAVFDNQGKILSQLHDRFEKGWQLFAISAQRSQLLFLKVFDNFTTKTIKILSSGAGNEGDRISYMGQTGPGSESLKSFTEAPGFVYYLGNQLIYTAYVEGYHEHIIFDRPLLNETYTFNLLPLWAATIPSVITLPVTNIMQTTAASGGNVISDGGSWVISRGICWSTSPYPTINDNYVYAGGGAGVFEIYLTWLTPNTTYFVRAFAQNSVGTAYGNIFQFSTLPVVSLPVVTTAEVTNISQTTATSGGNVTSGGGAFVTARGICWNILPNPTTSDNHTPDGADTGSFISYLTSLNPNTTYYVRAYASNSSGTGYGNELTFTTLPSGFSCASSMTINHAAGAVAPVSKTVTYGIVTNIPGQPLKCWINANLGADHQASSVNDATEASAGWYWQFNLKQGYKHDGAARTPNSTWITAINENFDWQAANDPCALELGSVWRVPSYSEWISVAANGGWANWNGPWNSALKLHAAGYLTYTDGSVLSRGTTGIYWSSSQSDMTNARKLDFTGGYCNMSVNNKASGYSVRCLRNSSDQILPTVTTASVTNTTSTTATCGGTVTSEGGSNVTVRGVCWSASMYPASSDDHTADGAGAGSFESYITSLMPNTLYYIRAYATSSLGTAYGNEMTITTQPPVFPCGSSLVINHVAGPVAPVTKTVSYGTVTNIPGEPSKCWITSNLGADHQAAAVNDNTEGSAGWCWQFNHKLGFSHDGTTRTPNTAWISSINEDFAWQAAGDPCALELGAGWRIPVQSEWQNINSDESWANWTGPWNSDLKLHAAGRLDYSAGSLTDRGVAGCYWSSSQYDAFNGLGFSFSSSGTDMYHVGYKPNGYSLRCVRD